MNRNLYLIGVLALGSLSGGFAQAARHASTCDTPANDLLGKVASDYALKDWGMLNADAAKLTPIKSQLDPDDQVVFDVILDSESQIPGATDAKPGTTTPPPGPSLLTPAPVAPAPVAPVAPTPVVPGVVAPARPIVVAPAGPVLPTPVTAADKVAVLLITKVDTDLADKNRVGGEVDTKHLAKLLNSKLSKNMRPVVLETLKQSDEWLNFPKGLLAKAQNELANGKWAPAEANIAILKTMTDLSPAEKAELAKEEEYLAKHKK